LSLQPGARIGHYVVVARLGSGGMGEVYRARDERLGRDVAIKAVRPEAAADRARIVRFLAEAKTVASLNHPNVLTLHDFGEHEGSPYLVTELIDGRTLRDVIAEGALAIDAALDLAVQIAEGLGKAHAAGIVHRDIKPENVMLTRDGHAKILDFGLAKLRDAGEAGADVTVDAQLTATGMILGTPAYMSPEQLRGRPADSRSDVFALGLLIYELVTGANPFRKDSAVETMNAILNEEPPTLARRSGIPAALSDVVGRATAKDPARRFANGRDLAGALDVLRKGSFAASRQPVRRALPVGRMAAVAALVAGTWLVWDLGRTKPDASLPSPPIPAVPVVAPPDAASFAPPEGKMGIAIVPIVDEAGDEELTRADIGRILADAFVQVLVDFPGFYVIDRYRLDSIAMQLGRSMQEAGADRALAREIGTRAAASAVLSGRLSRLGDSYILNATLTQIPGDVVLHSFQAQAGDAASLVAELTGRVTEDLRRKYSVSEEMPDVHGVATASLEAYTHYIRGDDLIHEGNWKAAVPELEQAVRIDPEMALAWSALSCAFSFDGREAEARAAFLQAKRFTDRLNEQERRWVELDGVWVNSQNGDLYLDAVEDYLEKYPDDHQSIFYAGLAWQWLKGDCDSALVWYERAHRVSPGWYPVTKAKVDCLLQLKRVDDARRILREYIALPSVREHGRMQATARLQEIQTGIQ
jgi:tRNA A-37 threonylcarbamoyl transferase component Bud32/tetratricopeptide (TPR) repeat protein